MDHKDHKICLKTVKLDGLLQADYALSGVMTALCNVALAAEHLAEVEGERANELQLQLTALAHDIATLKRRAEKRLKVFVPVVLAIGLVMGAFSGFVFTRNPLLVQKLSVAEHRIKKLELENDMLKIDVATCSKPPTKKVGRKKPVRRTPRPPPAPF